MIARFDWSWRRPSALVTRAVTTQRSGLNFWWLIGTLTVVFITWLLYRLLLQPPWLAQLPSAWLDLLALTETAWAFTLCFLWAAIGWRFVLAKERTPQPATPLPALNLSELYTLSPTEFEQYVGQLFRHKGYRVKWRGRRGDHGVDLELIQPGGKKAIVQCKRYQHLVGPEIVRELYGTLIHEQAAHAFLVTTADISTAARQWARGKPMTLIDGQTLALIAVALSQSNHVL